MKANAPAIHPATSFTGGSAPYRPLGPRVLSPRVFSQNAQPGGAGGQDGSGCQPAGGCQLDAGGAGQPGGELKVAMVSSPLGVTSRHRDNVLQVVEAGVDAVVVYEGLGEGVAEGAVRLEVPLVVELVAGGAAGEVGVFDGVLLEVPVEVAG